MHMTFNHQNVGSNPANPRYFNNHKLIGRLFIYHMNNVGSSPTGCKY